MINITCNKCDAMVDITTDALFASAVDAGWEPCYYEEGEEYEAGDPICPDCAAKCRIEKGELIWPVDAVRSASIESYAS